MTHPAQAGVLPNDVIPPTQECLIAIHRIKCCQMTSGSNGHFGAESAVSLLLKFNFRVISDKIVKNGMYEKFDIVSIKFDSIPMKYLKNFEL